MYIITLLLTIWFFMWFMISIKNPLDKLETSIYGVSSVMFLIITIFIWRI